MKIYLLLILSLFAFGFISTLKELATRDYSVAKLPSRKIDAVAIVMQIALIIWTILLLIAL